MINDNPVLSVSNLTMAYGDHVLQEGLDFSIASGEIFIIMGNSGCGKSTLLRHLTGLHKPAKGSVLFQDIDLWKASRQQRNSIMQTIGVLYQNGALWSSLTLAENIALPLQQFTDLSKKDIFDLVSFKLSLVGLGGYDHFFPSEISGGMKKRAGLARAIALDPKILFFDEPSAGLDPMSSKLLDDLILELRDSLGATIIIVSHELASIMTIATDSIFLDPSSKTVLARGNPRKLLVNETNSQVINFLTRGTE